MKILTYSMAILLVFGLLGVPSSVFAQESSSTGSDITSQYSTSTFLSYNFIPLLKGFKIGGSSPKKVKTGDGDHVDSADDSTDASSDGSGWISIIIILVALFVFIGILLWLFVLRK